MPVEPGTKAVLDAMAAEGGPALNEMSVPEARNVMKLLSALDGEAEPVASVEDRAIGGVPVRVYRADGVAGTDAPALVWYHGGGWVIGDLDSADTTARRLANRTGAVVVSVDYRLAPEHPFPAGPDDCLSVLEAIVANPTELGADPRRVAVGGDSAGGNLAAITAISARDAGIALRHQLLVYPATDATRSQPSMEENGEGYLLTNAAMEWFYDHYLGGHDPKDPRVSPLFADDLSGLAPATVITAEYDPLRDEGNAYADRLRDAGVGVELCCYEGQIHGFFGLTSITPAAPAALSYACARLC